LLKLLWAREKVIGLDVGTKAVERVDSASLSEGGERPVYTFADIVISRGRRDDAIR